MDYAQECRFGRQIAEMELTDCAMTGNYPKLIRTIRDFADHKHGVAVGFLQAIAEKATQEAKE